jgi:hypothetical protein
MDEKDYLRLAETIPDDWYTDQDAKEITSTIFYNIMIKSAEEENLVIKNDGDFKQLIQILSEKNNVPFDDVLMDIKNVATTLGAIKLFEFKYPQFSELFPVGDDDRPEYPPEFIAKILGVDIEVAVNLLEGVFLKYKEFLK